MIFTVNIETFFRKNGEIILHFLGLLWFFTSINVAWQSDWGDWEHHKTAIHPFSALIFPLVFYTNVLWLIPGYLKKRKWGRYAVFSLAFALLTEGARSVLFLSLNDEVKHGFVEAWSKEFLSYKHCLGAVVNGFLLSLAYVFARDWIVNLSLIEKLKTEKLSAELAFLKSQVDPHFLFNTLNSLYAAALEEKAHCTADGIIKLSTLMRYNLHDSQADFILLEKEIDYIEKFIALQRLRTTDKTRIDFLAQIRDESRRGEKIAPMLLIPFIENAFKYGLSPVLETSIRIRITLKEGVLNLTVENTIVEKPTAGPGSGVGLENVKNRLNILYPDRHQLLLEEKNSIFYARLQINLQR